jgi:hypothetical protein
MISELAIVKEDIQLIRDALTGHVAKEDHRGHHHGALIALLLSSSATC